MEQTFLARRASLTAALQQPRAHSLHRRLLSEPLLSALLDLLSGKGNHVALGHGQTPHWLALDVQTVERGRHFGCGHELFDGVADFDRFVADGLVGAAAVGRPFL